MDASEGIDGRKRVALALLGLRRADRQWLLGQLPDSERDGVVAMLGELERMKLPAAPQQIAAVAHAVTAERGEPQLAPWPDDAQPAPGEPPASDDAQPRHALARLSTAAVHRALRDEPDAVIASVSALADASWAAELTGRFEPARAAAIARLRGKGSGVAARGGERAARSAERTRRGVRRRRRDRLCSRVARREPARRGVGSERPSLVEAQPLMDTVIRAARIDREPLLLGAQPRAVPSGGRHARPR